MKLDEDAKERLGEILDSTGWHIVVDKLIPDAAVKLSGHVFRSVKAGNSVEAQVQAGKHDGLLEAIVSIYEAAGRKAPINIMDLRRN